MKAFILILLFLSSFAYSQDKLTPTHACFKDAPIHCKKDEKPSRWNSWFCLGKKMTMLSEGCQSFMKDFILQNFDCGKEILSYCTGNNLNYGNHQKCLKGRMDLLSKKCIERIKKNDEYESGAKLILLTCKLDKKRHCNSLDEGQCGEKLNAFNVGELSPECQQKLGEYHKSKK